MGVRRSSVGSRGRAGGGWSALRAVALWGFLLAGSFVFGMLVVSPMINAVHPSSAEAPSGPAARAATTSTPPSQPEPPLSAASDRGPAPQPISARPGIQVTPDQTPRVQKTETPDQESGTQTTPAQPDAAQDSGSISVDSSSGSNQAALGATSDTGTAADTGSPRRARRRGRRHPPSDLSVQPGSPAAGGVQPSESIDQ